MVAHTFKRGHKIEYIQIPVNQLPDSECPYPYKKITRDKAEWEKGDITGFMYQKGHITEFVVGLGWVYSDTKESTDIERPCKKCGKMPTTEGHDACLGTLDKVKFACCGHGVEEGYEIREPDGSGTGDKQA